MSRLTSKAPFNRPSVFDFLPTRPTPLSPPETEREPGLLQLQEETYGASETHHVPNEGSIPRLRRNVAYTSSSVLNREPRVPQRQSKWLIMIMPPASLMHEPPVLGHTLSSAPAGRFSNGILMPLFPTLYNQVTAIAREFNMPSTTGLCVYLQLKENSSMLTPRISDETWQILWAQHFVTDDRTAPLPSHGLPIAGRVEFDIDLRRAKWFNNWIGNPTRDRMDVDGMALEPSVVPTHWRGDSRYSITPAEQPGEESPSPPSVNAPSFRAQRQLPRLLFLEKRDTSIKSISRHPSRIANVSQDVGELDLPTQLASKPLAHPAFVSNDASPEIQEPGEPGTAKKAELDMLVRQWRASSVVGEVTTAIAAVGQPSLDPVNMPAGTDVKLDLDDFAWSISSAGPPSESPMSLHWPKPLPSIHLVDRLQGSVCLTPTTCTSWGPPDTPDYFLMDVSRQPSPDLGLRMMEFVPLTPSTATSWGPDLPSPSLSAYDYEYRAPSIDVGQRATGSVPVTPSTATSWGPADSPLFLGETSPYTRTPDVGERGFADLQDQPALSLVPRNATRVKPWRHVWPYIFEHNMNLQDQLALSLVPRNATRVQPWRHVWPYIFEHNMKIQRALLPEYPDFASLYPSDCSQPRTAANRSKSVSLNEIPHYPRLEIYPAVYPYNLIHIYRPVSISADLLTERPDEPTQNPVNTKSVTLPSCYPVFNIYPAVYPHNLVRIYPHQHVSQKENMRTDMSLKHSYPCFSIYPASYPHNLNHIYLSRSQNAIKDDTHASHAQRVQSPSSYPVIEPYPPTYPYNLERIYPTLSRLSVNYLKLSPSRKSIVKVHPAEYPLYLKTGAATTIEEDSLVIAQLPFEYPAFNIYPSVYPYNMEQVYPSIGLSTNYAMSARSNLPDGKPPSATLNSEYPVIEIYPNVYPYNLEEIYPPPLKLRSWSTSKRYVSGLFDNPSSYVEHKRYPYNLFDIYPPRGVRRSSSVIENSNPSASQRQFSPQELSICLPVALGYPVFDLYPVHNGYPTAEIYSPVTIGTPPLVDIMHLRLNGAYPYIEIYEPVYPHLVIYPPVLSEGLRRHYGHSTKDIFKLKPSRDGLSVTLFTTYPAIHLYEPVYPHLDIYPRTQVIGYDEYFATEEAVRHHRKRVPTPGPDHRHRSRVPHPPSYDHEQPRASRSHVKRPLLPPLPGTITSLPSNIPFVPQSYTIEPVKRPRRTHHELYMMVYDEVQRAVKHQENLVSELLLRENIRSNVTSRITANRSPTPVPRQRGRSGTVSNRLPQLVADPSQANSQDLASNVGGPSRPDLYTLRTVPASSPDSSISRRIVVGLPSSPVQTRADGELPSPSSVLGRVRSMNSKVRPNNSHLENQDAIRGSDRSIFLSGSDTIIQGQSVVQDKARMFSLTEPSETNNLVSPHLPPTTKPISKLDRSKIPFS